MAITSYGGFDGVPITEPQFGTSLPNWANQMGVIGAGDWQVTAGSNPGQLNIAAGTGWAYGVTADSDSITSVIQPSLPAGSGATRWDLLAMRRDWQPPGGTCDFVIVQGSADKKLPAAADAPGSTGRQVFPGVVHDQPIALVQWTAGYSSPTQIIDLRSWASNGGTYAKDDLVKTFLDQVGTMLKIGPDQWSRDLDANGSAVWQRVPTSLTESTQTKPDSVPWRNFTALIEAASGTDANGYGEFRFGTKGLPKFTGIASVQLTPFHPIEAFMFNATVQAIDTTKIRFRARRLDNSGWASGYGSISCFVTVVGW